MPAPHNFLHKSEESFSVLGQEKSMAEHRSEDNKIVAIREMEWPQTLLKCWSSK